MGTRSTATGMAEETTRKPRFRIGEQVRPVGPSVPMRRSETGLVTEVTDSAGIYRYHVTFADGRAEAFFGFELQSVDHL